MPRVRASRFAPLLCAASVLASAGTVHAQLVDRVAVGEADQTSATILITLDEPGRVRLELSRTPDFADIVANPVLSVFESLVPGKVRLTGLMPGQVYFLRQAGQAQTLTRFTTPERADAGLRPLRIAALTDWQQAPPFPSVRNVAHRNPDLILKLGDTIFADLETPILPGQVQARTLEDFRLKHLEILSERPEAPGSNFMDSVYRAAPLLFTIDDHELVDNFAGGALPGESPDAGDINPGEPPLFVDPVPYVNETQAYLDAMRAYTDWHPTLPQAWVRTGDPRTDGKLKLYRHRTYGTTASFTMLDSRGFRDVQLPPFDPANPLPFLVQAFDPTRTLLGRVQVEQLKGDLLLAERSRVLWKFVVIPEPIQNFGPANAEDRFEGYAAERAEILRFIEQNGIANVVFLAGDFHGTLVNNLTYQDGPGQPQIATGAFEIVTGPVSFFTGRFGPAVVSLAEALGILDPAQRAFYDGLPIALDPDSVVDDKDDFIKSLVDGQTIPLGYDPIGLDRNLPQAMGRIDATLELGDYVNTHVYSWAELDIADDGELTVRVWSTDAHSEADFLADPDAVVALQPQEAVRFTVRPQALSCYADFDKSGTVTAFDFLEFQNAFDAGAMDADCDGDGALTVFDFLCFQSAFAAGCD